MADMNCMSEDKYRVEGDGRCCDRCPAGKYKKRDCNSTTLTLCADCTEGKFLATKNHMTKCNLCKQCPEASRLITLTNCTATQDTVCQCQPGYYCANKSCEHCNPVTQCPVGEGVIIQASRTNDTVCAPCKEGTYSNVSDIASPCKAHTRCEDFGRVVKTQGTASTDAVCGDFKTHCSWMLPAGLWAGLVFTILLVFIFLIWRAKYKSFRAVKTASRVPMAGVPSPPVTPPELSSHCQETCTIDVYKIQLLNEDDTRLTCCIQDSLESSLPITTTSKMKTSVSFVECDDMNGHAQYPSPNFLRSHSEPQEDEYCGT